jgi:origin recognition complex subunit 4
MTKLLNIKMQDSSDEEEKSDGPLTELNSYTDFTEADQSGDFLTDDPTTDAQSIFTEDEEPRTDTEEVQQVEDLVEVFLRGKQFGREEQLPQPLPSHLHDALSMQKLAVLSALKHPPYPDSGMEERNKSKKVLENLLKGSIERGEGNSCLVLGPKGCGKTRVRVLPYVCAQIFYSS